MNKQRIMVDMSATLLHHGHIRLLKKASEFGEVVVGLTTDDEILSKKCYHPEMEFEFRKEILEGIRYVDEVVASPWLLDDPFLDQHQIDFLVHGDDNSNLIEKSRLKVFPRTEGISSNDVRQSSLRSITEINNQKLMLTPGPAVVLHENLKEIKPLFGRGDEEYQQMAEEVLEWVKKVSGQDEVVMAQGSATFALELAAHSFVSGKVLLVSTGYYSDRLIKLLPDSCEVTQCKYEDLVSVAGSFDFVMCAYSETSIAFKVNLQKIRDKANQCGAKLYVDATGSIGLEEDHELADVMAFSSCKGLFGLTGACFVAYKSEMKVKEQKHFYFNLETHKNKMVTGPYHAVASLYGVKDVHEKLRQRVINSKNAVLQKWPDLVRQQNQPLLCTYLEGQVSKADENVVLYTPRSDLSGSVICHFGELHSDVLKITERIKVS